MLCPAPPPTQLLSWTLSQDQNSSWTSPQQRPCPRHQHQTIDTVESGWRRSHWGSLIHTHKDTKCTHPLGLNAFRRTLLYSTVCRGCSRRKARPSPRVGAVTPPLPYTYPPFSHVFCVGDVTIMLLMCWGVWPRLPLCFLPNSSQIYLLTH